MSSEADGLVGRLLDQMDRPDVEQSFIGNSLGGYFQFKGSCVREIDLSEVVPAKVLKVTGFDRLKGQFGYLVTLAA